MSAIGIIVWFLKGVMSDFNALKIEVTEHDREIGVIKANHDNSNKRFDELKSDFKAVADKIDTVIMKLNQPH
jgi:hypothetical protein